MTRSSISSSASTTDRPARLPAFGASARHALALGAVAGIAACSAGAAPPDMSGPVDPSFETAALQSTRLGETAQVVFDWTLQDRDARFSGQGVTRVEPPSRARLDLFGPRGEGYLSAALVDMDLRLPPGAEDVPLPPAALFWSALGVFHPPEGAELVGTRRDGAATTLAYARGDEHWTFRLENEALNSAEWIDKRGGRRTVQLTAASGSRYPQVAVYRDWPAFRELKMTVDRTEPVDHFPSDIWTIAKE